MVWTCRRVLRQSTFGRGCIIFDTQHFSILRSFCCFMGGETQNLLCVDWSRYTCKNEMIWSSSVFCFFVIKWQTCFSFLTLFYQNTAAPIFQISKYWVTFAVFCFLESHKQYYLLSLNWIVSSSKFIWILVGHVKTYCIPYVTGYCVDNHCSPDNTSSKSEGDFRDCYTR